jgi:SAM-dependent methyltransferase
MTDAVSYPILIKVADYYSKKLEKHGETARGVDWNGEESQTVRFAQLCRIIDPATAPSDRFSLNDIGCGYGALYDFLLRQYRASFYAGVDVSAGMIEAARRRHMMHPRASFEIGSIPAQPSDYGVASGIFNVRLGLSDAEWFAHLSGTLDVMNETSLRGFAFNCLTIYSDAAKMRDHLYYADPGVLFDLCKRRYSRHIALLHDYGLYEFTILVRKLP